MTKQIAIPQVARIENDRGSHIEPPLGEDWDEARKLAWRAAVFACDTGQQVKVYVDTLQTEDRRGGWRPVPGMYSLNIGRSTYGPYSYRDAWLFLGGVQAGLSLGERQ